MRYVIKNANGEYLMDTDRPGFSPSQREAKRIDLDPLTVPNIDTEKAAMNRIAAAWFGAGTRLVRLRPRAVAAGDPVSQD